MNIVILGPTAVGKTELSLRLAEELESPIISVDSRQCYKHLNIGTATPTEEELERVQHFNISILDPDQNDNIAEFQKRVQHWSKDLEFYDHHLYVGGSTLYLQSVIAPIDNLPESNPDNIRNMQKKIESEGIESLYKMLQRVDPEYATRMDGMNRHRIIRALDVWMQTDKPFSSFHSHKELKLPSDMLVIGLTRNRETIYKRIEKRVDRMIEEGLVAEVKSILDMGYTHETQALQTVGYREIIDYFEGRMDSVDSAVEKIKTNTRRYAKRQLTWFNRWPFIKWINLDDLGLDSTLEIIMLEVAAKANKG